jgi:tRNA(Ser,Leu) C12 N-acetylase TAN1
MSEWTVVASTYPESFERGRQLLEQFGRVERTDYFNVLVLTPDDPAGFLERFAAMTANVPSVLEILSRVMPAACCFDFQSSEEFETKARAAVLEWLSGLSGKTFHVRMRRRGFKRRMSSQAEERFLDEVLLAALQDAGAPGRIDFEDPDAVIDVETVGGRAGLAFWTREDLRRYPFLKVD